MSADQQQQQQQPRLDGKYWQDRWVNGQTQWRDREREENPFERNAASLHKTIVELAPESDHEADKITDTTPATLFRGCNVFVPLCGDTPALGFWAKQMGCHVVGVDIAEASLARALEEQFAGRDVSVIADNGHGIKVFSAPAPGGSGEGDVTLLAGDAFHVMSEPASYGLAATDVVYDRASMVAIEPELREKYVAALKHVLAIDANGGKEAPRKSPVNGFFARQGGEVRRHRALFLNTIERPVDLEDADAHLKKGPPFHISAQDVFDAYSGGKPGDDAVRMVVPVGDDRSKLTGPEGPPFIDAYYVVICRSAAV